MSKCTKTTTKLEKKQKKTSKNKRHSNRSQREQGKRLTDSCFNRSQRSPLSRPRLCCYHFLPFALHESGTCTRKPIFLLVTIYSKNLSSQYRIKCFFSGVHACVHGADALINWIKFVSASALCTHAWTPEKNRLILIILQYESFSYFNYFCVLL